MKLQNKTLLNLINDEVSLWKPAKKFWQTNPKEAKEQTKQANSIAEKLYRMHAIVGEHPSYKIFGYGSLLNERSRDRTMLPITVTYGRIMGYQRIFNLSIKQGTCLNIKPKDGGLIDGAICEIDKGDMLSFMLREFQYNILKEKTEEGDDVFLVMATEEDTDGVVKSTFKEGDKGFDWQNVMPRLDYIQACYHGIEKLAREFNTDHLFLTEDTTLFDDEPLSEFIEELSPTLPVATADGTVEDENFLLSYWSTIDSAY